MQLRIVLLCSFILSGCALLQPADTSKNRPIPSQVFAHSFEDVWQAAHVALIKYRLRVDNHEAGIVETENVADTQFYSPPFQVSSDQVGYRYRLELRFVKGAVGKKPSTRVAIFKRIERQTTIVDERELVASDGLEEKALLYRIERELIIQSGLKRAQKRNELKDQQKQEELLKDPPKGG